MNETFVLKIELGNDAMRTGNDIADALYAVADALHCETDYPTHWQNIQDENGNTVGRFAVKHDVKIETGD